LICRFNAHLDALTLRDAASAHIIAPFTITNNTASKGFIQLEKDKTQQFMSNMCATFSVNQALSDLQYTPAWLKDLCT